MYQLNFLPTWYLAAKSYRLQNQTNFKDTELGIPDLIIQIFTIQQNLIP